MKSWQEVDLGGNLEHEGAKDQIDRENVHDADPSCILMRSGLSL